MRDVVLGDGIVDHLSKNAEAAKILPGCIQTLKAGWTQHNACRSCGSKKRGHMAMDPNARERFRRCLLKANADDIARLKRLLEVDSLTIYDRSDGNLKTVKL